VIFVTVGSMFPFDRLVRAMDAWAAAHPGEEVLAQIGDGDFLPSHMRWLRRLDRGEFDDTVRRARLVVAHAGVGSVVTARTIGRPVVVLPRRRQLGEHTSDHQVETVGWLRGRPGIHVADREEDLAARIAEATAARAGAALRQTADPAFLRDLRGFVLRRRLLAVASGGGHWMQLRRIAAAFEGFETVYVSVDPVPPVALAGQRYYQVRDASRRSPLAFVPLAPQLTRILLKERPEVVVTTGAAPGLVALALARRLCGSRTVWIDSIANAERMSTSGEYARRVADVWLTQWEHLARPEGPHYWGSVL
jgi:UDP-N-acetylglucosamine transferase subunit ALG13